MPDTSFIAAVTAAGPNGDETGTKERDYGGSDL
jgi:hypothetical protein